MAAQCVCAMAVGFRLNAIGSANAGKTSQRPKYREMLEVSWHAVLKKKTVLLFNVRALKIFHFVLLYKNVNE